MIKILAVSPLKFDGTSYYRAWGVFKDLASKVPIEVHDYVQRPGGWNWADFLNYDILFLQRPGTPEHHKLAQYCRDMGRKLWVDYDDNFFILPPENRMYEAVGKDARQRMTDIIRWSDVLTVSTEALKTFMLQVGAKNVEVIPNALNDKLIQPAKAYNNKRPPVPPNPARQVYTWRGSDTHWMDVFDYLDPLTQAMAARQDVDWYFMAWKPNYLDRFGLPYKFIQADDIFGYFNKLRTIRPEIMHVMLTANEFNLHKSNIAWIEATTAGAVCVAPDWPEWQRPGVLNYSSGDQYKDYLIGANDLPLAHKWQESMDFIQENLLLSKVNEKRADIVEKLMSGVNLPIPQSMIE